MRFECGEVEKVVIAGEEFSSKDGFIDIPEKYTDKELIDLLSAHGLKKVIEEKKPEGKKRA